MDQSSNTQVLLQGEFFTSPFGTGLFQYTRAVQKALEYKAAILLEVPHSTQPGLNSDRMHSYQIEQGHYVRSWVRNVRTRLGMPLIGRQLCTVCEGTQIGDLRSHGGVYSIPGGFHESNWIFYQSHRRPAVRIPEKFDVYHSIQPSALKVLKVPEVVTVHDLFQLHTQCQFPTQGRYYLDLLKAVCRDAAVIITVSEATWRELTAVVPSCAAKARVVYSAPSIEFTENNKRDNALIKEYGLEPEGYILHLANIEPKKNLGRLIEAYASLETNLPLVVVGRKAWDYESELRGLEMNPSISKRVKLLGFIPVEHREALNKYAQIFAFPSLREGFGIPVLDAATCGRPILAAEIGSLREICGAHAEYVNPLDVRDIARGLKRLIETPSLRNELGQSVREKVRSFSISNHRAGLQQAYREAMR